MDWNNQLYFGDNLRILREYVPEASVDLIYLDPPFNSNASYNVLFKEKSGEESAGQITAFEDTWQWGLESEAVYKEIVTDGALQLARDNSFFAEAPCARAWLMAKLNWETDQIAPNAGAGTRGEQVECRNA